MRYFAIGDIHGHILALDRILEEIEKLSGNETYKIIFIGDYVDRGPSSAEVLDRVFYLESVGKAILLRGNHEQLMYDGLMGYDKSGIWEYNGGIETLQSLKNFEENTDINQDVRQKFINWYRNSKLYHIQDNMFFVHAGINPHTYEKWDGDLSKIDDNIFLWVRDEFLRWNYKFPWRIVHGHTPKSPIEILPNRINIDTGCGKGGYLTCIEIDTNQQIIKKIIASSEDGKEIDFKDMEDK